MAEQKYIPRLKQAYDSKIKAELKEELGLKNINQVPKLEKIIVSSGVGKKREDKRFTETVGLTLQKITGQMPTARLAKKSIAQFKIRKGMGAPVGYLVTLRNDKMYEALMHKKLYLHKVACGFCIPVGIGIVRFDKRIDICHVFFDAFCHI